VIKQRLMRYTRRATGAEYQGVPPDYPRSPQRRYAVGLADGNQRTWNAVHPDNRVVCTMETRFFFCMDMRDIAMNIVRPSTCLSKALMEIEHVRAAVHREHVVTTTI